MRVDNWQEVEKIISPYIQEYYEVMIAEDSAEPKIVKTLQDSLTIVGDIFYGKDEIVEFKTINGYFGQVTRSISNGIGTAYRNKEKGFVLGVNIHNRWREGKVTDIANIIG